MSSLTAQVVLAGKRELNPLEGSVMRRDTALMFHGDPTADQTGWASGQPSLNVQVTAIGEVADGFYLGNTYTLTIGAVEPEQERADVRRVEEPAPDLAPRWEAAPPVEPVAAPEVAEEPAPVVEHEDEGARWAAPVAEQEPAVVEDPAVVEPDADENPSTPVEDGKAKVTRRRR